MAPFQSGRQRRAVMAKLKNGWGGIPPTTPGITRVNPWAKHKASADDDADDDDDGVGVSGVELVDDAPVEEEADEA
jgi:hypothetical protein